MTSKRPQSATKKRAASKFRDSGKQERKITVPSWEEWAESYLKFREALNQLYLSPNAKWKTDSAFCKDQAVSRAQFSRVITGNEKPSPSIAVKLREALPKTYSECERKWIDSRRKVIVKVEDLADEMWQHLSKNIPGHLFALTSRPPEHASDALPEGAARLLKASDDNRITFIFGNLLEDIATLYPALGTGNFGKSSCWPLADKGRIGGYIDAILSATNEGMKAREYARQIRCLSVSFLELVNYRGQAAPRIADLLARQLLSPTQIWMLYVGTNGSLFAIVYSKFGDNYGWNRVTQEESQYLFQYVCSIIELQSVAPDLVRDLPLESLSTHIRNLRSVFPDINPGANT